jgi:hypothetical protein
MDELMLYIILFCSVVGIAKLLGSRQERTHGMSSETWADIIIHRLGDELYVARNVLPHSHLRVAIDKDGVAEVRIWVSSTPGNPVPEPYWGCMHQPDFRSGDKLELRFGGDHKVARCSLQEGPPA